MNRNNHGTSRGKASSTGYDRSGLGGLQGATKAGMVPKMTPRTGIVSGKGTASRTQKAGVRPPNPSPRDAKQSGGGL